MPGARYDIYLKNVLSGNKSVLALCMFDYSQEYLMFTYSFTKFIFCRQQSHSTLSKTFGENNIRVDISWDNLLLRNKIRASERILMLKANWEITAPELFKSRAIISQTNQVLLAHEAGNITQPSPCTLTTKEREKRTCYLSGHLKFADPERDSARKTKMHGVVSDLCFVTETSRIWNPRGWVGGDIILWYNF